MSTQSTCNGALQQTPQSLRIRHAIATGWLGLEEAVALHGGLSTAATVFPIELATSPLPSGQADQFVWGSPRYAPGVWLYRKMKRWAHGVKVALQMAVGIGAVVGLCVHTVNVALDHQSGASFTGGTVKIIAGALAVAAGVELAYTLYTPGPDEALNPLMLGLASAILLLITRDDSGLSATSQFLAALLGVLALGALFLIRRHLLDEEEN